MSTERRGRMQRGLTGVGFAGLLFFISGCEYGFYGFEPYETPALPAPKVISTDFVDAIAAPSGGNRRIFAQAREGQIYSVVFETSSVSFPNNLVSLPGVEIERLAIVTITPGTIDLVIKTTTGILFLEGQADGTFGGPVRTIFTGQLDAVDGNSLSFADADMDGDTDIIAGGGRSDTVPPNSVEVRLLINDGSGNFSNPSTLQQPTDLAVLASISAGDVNNDGFPEIAVSGANTRLLTVHNSLLWFYSTSTGQAQASPTTPIEGSGVDSILSDLNDDNRDDFISTRPSGAGIAVRLAQPSGALGPAQNYSTGYFNRIIAGDFNGDGHVDVAAHSYSPSGLSIFDGDGSGILAPPKTVDAPAAAYRLEFLPALPGFAFPAGFFTVDPFLDSIQSFAIGLDGPISTDRRSYTRDGGEVSVKDVALADVNGDGYVDVIASEINVPELNFALNAADGSGQFITNNHDRISQLNRIASMRPVSGQADNRAAVAITLTGSTTAAVMRLNSTTTPTDWIPISVLALPEPGVDVATGDLNGDGRDDAIFSHAGGNRAISVALQDSAGLFAYSASFSVPGGAWNRVAVGDLNGDGRPETIVYDTVSGEMRTLLNDGSGAFAPVAGGAIAFPPPLSADVAFGDVDGDGDVDVIVGAGPSSLANGSVHVAHGNGSGGFVDSFAIPAPAPVQSVARGDINGDGISDVVFATASGSSFIDGSLGCIPGTPGGLSESVSYHYINGDPKGVFIVDLKNPMSLSRRAGAPLPAVLVVAYTGVAPYEGICVLEPIGAPSCPADLNTDGFVDDSDFVIFLGAYNILDCTDPAMPSGCPADFNHDSLVDDADFVIFVAAYNELLCP